MSKRKASYKNTFNGKASKIQRFDQNGRGRVNIPVFTARPLQRGFGLGGVLFRNVLPFIKKGLTKVGQRALNAGANALADVADNNISFKEAIKKQAKNELRSLGTIINRGSTTKKYVSSTKNNKKSRPLKRGNTGFKKITL